MLSTDRIDDLRKDAIKGLQEAGVIEKRAADDESEKPTYEIHVGDDIRVVAGLGQGLPRIRVVPLVGIYEMTGVGEGVGAELVTYVDAQTLRALLGLSLGSSGEIALDYEQTELLDRVETRGSGALEEEFFSEDLFADDPFGALACVPALPSASSACASLNCSRDAAAMADPNGPQVAVLCQIR